MKFSAIVAVALAVVVASAQAQSCYNACRKQGLEAPYCEDQCVNRSCLFQCQKVADYSYCKRSCMEQ
ncbi:hypothetical protein BGX31_011244 [Mortierella sp. GBA43]|nr:hypothetical protein BGX31_011244 [Mortierella sp. GBA43]